MRVYSKNFDYLYDVVDATEVQIDSFYVGTSNLTMILPITHDAVHFIQKNGWIVTDDGRPFVVKVIEQNQSEVTYTAYSGHKLLCQRVAKQGNVSCIQKSADFVVKFFINAIKGDLPVTTAPWQDGPKISEKIRLTNLGDKVYDILYAAGRGEKFELIEGSGIKFDTYTGTDRSLANAADNAPVVFALEYGNIDEPIYMQDGTTEQTTVYVAGAGEGENRELVVDGDSVTGVDRVEVIIDAKDVEPGDINTLAQRAAQCLIDDTITVSACAIADSNMKYGTDYSLGDICTIKVNVKSYEQSGEYYDRTESTVNVNKQLVEVVESYSGGSLETDLVFGTVTQSATSVTKKEVDSLKAVDSVSASAGGAGVTGAITMWAANTAPDGWLLCNGGSVSRDDYEDLFNVIGTTYGGNGSPMFNLPNLKGKTPVGYNSGDGSFNALGKTGGAKTHTLTVSQMPSHTHTQNSHTHTQNSHTHSINHDHANTNTGYFNTSHAHSFSDTSTSAGGHGHSIWWGSDRPISLSSGSKTPPANNYSSSGYRTGYSGGSVYEWAMNAKAVGNHTHNVSGTTGGGGSNHRHSVNTPAFSGNSGGKTATNNSTTATNKSTGGGSSHNNLQPYIVLNYIIKT